VTAALRLDRAPWTPGALVWLLISQAVVAVWLGVCWVGVSTTTAWSTQLTWVAAAIGGIVVSGLGLAWWVLTGQQEIRYQRRLYFRRVAYRDEQAAGGVASSRRTDPTPTSNGQGLSEGVLVSGGAMTRFHRASCQLARGKPVIAGSREGHVAAGRIACGVCRP
jgi:hypothetical protein